MKTIFFGLVALLLVAIAFLWYFNLKVPPAHTIVCTTEAKVCADGSSVGRSGPLCEFTKCPTIVPPIHTNIETEATVASLNQNILTNTVHIKPLEVLEDSRCPADVMCIQAGTVRLRVLLEKGGETETTIVTLSSPVVFAGKIITLVGVVPTHLSTKTITAKEYRFEFSVKDNKVVEKGMLMGSMTIGPVCPVERVGIPCNPTPAMYEAHSVAVYTSDKKTLVSTLTPKSDGTFSISLANGSYYVTMASQQQGPGSVSGVPKTITIKNNEAVHLQVTVDTGIR